MKTVNYLSKLLFLLMLVIPIANVSADTHEDVTMGVIEHSDSEHYENEIELPHSDDLDERDSNHNESNDGHHESEDENHNDSDDVHHESDDDSRDDSSDSKTDD